MIRLIKYLHREYFLYTTLAMLGLLASVVTLIICLWGLPYLGLLVAGVYGVWLVVVLVAYQRESAHYVRDFKNGAIRK
jgi:hypothetical protein